ncbi:E3 ubiquitin-protein ligase TRIM35-like [Festucalex cinctus]
MASRFEDHLKCLSCLGTFEDPVILSCSHSFCRGCVEKCWDEKGDQSCPVCRKRYLRMDVRSNLALSKVCEAFSQTSVELDNICSLHGKKLKFFCTDHQECVCISCLDTERHYGHMFHSINEEVQKFLLYAKKNREYFKKIRLERNEEAVHIKVQRDKEESKIKKKFEELRRLLQADEQDSLSDVRKEEEEECRLVKEKIEILDNDIAALSDVIRSTEEHLTSDPVSSSSRFMNYYQAVKTVIEKVPHMSEQGRRLNM